MQGNAVPFDTLRHLCMQYLTYTYIHTCCMSTCLACLHVWLYFCFPIYVHVHDSFHLHCNLYSSPIFRTYVHFAILICSKIAVFAYLCILILLCSCNQNCACLYLQIFTYLHVETFTYVYMVRICLHSNPCKHIQAQMITYKFN